MRHKNHGRRLGRTTEHRTAMLRNLVMNLFEHERVMTTIPKAKEARMVAEKIITLARKYATETDPAKKLHYRRQATQKLGWNRRLEQPQDLEGNKQDAREEESVVRVVEKLISVLGPRFKDRNGGYTRILRAGYRLGDGADIALFELV